jgi:HAD superfamily hydrolase (TIGR01509 family)
MTPLPDVTTRAVLFDLGNTLVSYYTSAEFPLVLRRCLRECLTELALAEDLNGDNALLERALLLNRERPDHAVRPLSERLAELFGPHVSPDTALSQALVPAFLKPIFATARLAPHAVSVLDALRASGIKTAIVSNTPWGSPGHEWRDELRRHGLDRVDAAVFCTDVGWRKPHRAPFDRALSLLGVAPSEALFVGDDYRWDVVGALNAGLRPVLLGSKLTSSATDHLIIEDLGQIIAVSAASSGAA